MIDFLRFERFNKNKPEKNGDFFGFVINDNEKIKYIIIESALIYFGGKQIKIMYNEVESSDNDLFSSVSHTIYVKNEVIFNNITKKSVYESISLETKVCNEVLKHLNLTL